MRVGWIGVGTSCYYDTCCLSIWLLGVGGMLAVGRIWRSWMWIVDIGH